MIVASRKLVAQVGLVGVELGKSKDGKWFLCVETWEDGLSWDSIQTMEFEPRFESEEEAERWRKIVRGWIYESVIKTGGVDLEEIEDRLKNCLVKKEKEDDVSVEG